MNRTIVLWVLACIAAPSFAQRIRIDFDHKNDFSRYKTYSWAASQQQQFPNQIMQERIVRMVEEALAARQLKRVDKGGDILVDYQVDVAAEPQFTTFTNGIGPAWGPGWGSGWGPGWGWGSGWNSSVSTTTTETLWLGTLVIDLVDSRKKQLVFQGTSTDTLSSRPEKNTRRFKRGIDKIFGRYPPR